MEILQSKKLIWLIAGILVLAVGGAAFWWYNNQDKNSQSDQEALKVQKTVVAQEEVPPKFPAGIPLEKGAEVLQNYTATNASGAFQATRTFVTKKSLAYNFDIYKKYFTDRKWNIESTTDLETLKGISARKDDYLVQVQISHNSNLNRDEVELSVQQILPIK